MSNQKISQTEPVMPNDAEFTLPQDMSDNIAGSPVADEDKSAKLASWSSLLAALGMTSCCILPLGLAMMGVTGTFIGTLSQLKLYQPWLLGFATLSLAWGFWRAYRPLPAGSCSGTCATAERRRMTRIVLWVALGIVIFTQLFTYWIAPTFLNPFG